MATIYNNIDIVANQPKLGVKISVDLVWDKDLSPVATEAANESMVQGPNGTSTDVEGYWEMEEVVPNDEITPADSLYRVTEYTSDEELSIYYISVPSGATPVYWTGDLLEPKPSWEE